MTAEEPGEPGTFEDPTGSEFSSSTLRATLDSIDAASSYADWVVSHADPVLGDLVLEIGAGVGTLTPRLLSSGGPQRRVHACEPDPVLAAVLSERFEDDPRVVVEQRPVQDLPDSTAFDSAVFVNVLEHIPDDVGALEAAYRVLRPGGHVYVYSPAFELLMSPFDREIGHCRRYRLPELGAKARRAGFEVETLRYANLPGWFAWLLVARVLGKNPTDGGLAGVYDRRFVPATRWVEARVKPPFGQSALVVARKP